MIRLTQPQVEAIRQLEGADGRLTPQQVVEAARSKDSPLHELFDWNIRSAASKWHLHQARTIIGAVRLQTVTNETVISNPCYVVDRDTPEAGYRSVTALKKNPASARESLIFTLEVAAGHLRRAYDLSVALSLQHEVMALVEQVTGLQRKVDEAA
jgi:hypothetical protein